MHNWPNKRKETRKQPQPSAMHLELEQRILLKSQSHQMKIAQSDRQILEIIKHTTPETVEYLSIEASKKLYKWEHWISLRLLVDLLITKNTTVPVRVYDMLIHQYCFNGNIETAFTMLLQMEMQNVIPSKSTIRKILSGCKKNKNGISIAENVWHKMLTKYNIVPDQWLYNVMIGVYAFHRNVERTEFYFQEILRKTNKSNSNKLIRICGHMFWLYGSVNEQRKTFEMEQFMRRNKIKFDAYAYTNLIRACLIFEDIEKAILIFKQIEANELIKIDSHLLGTVAAAYSKGIALCCSKKQISSKIHKYLNTLKHEIPLRYPTFIDGRYKKIVFDSVLWQYLNNWKHESVTDAFEYAFDKEQMGCSYWTFWQDKEDEKLHRPAIDFHNLSHIAVRYILRHIFCYERHNLKIFKPLFVVCGKGNHRLHHHLTIKETIIEELNGWCPQIRTAVADFNDGLMRFDEDDIARFLEQNESITPSSECFSKLSYNAFHRTVTTSQNVWNAELLAPPGLLGVTCKASKIAKLMEISSVQGVSWPLLGANQVTPSTTIDFDDDRLSESSNGYVNESFESSLSKYDVFEDERYKPLKRKYDQKKQKYDKRYKKYFELRRRKKIILMQYQAANKALKAQIETLQGQYQAVQDRTEEYDGKREDDSIVNSIYQIVFVCFILFNAFVLK